MSITIRSIGPLALLTSSLLVSALACSATSDSTSFESAPGTTSDSGRAAPSPEPKADAGAIGLPPSDDVRGSALVIVNASRTFPAFRICNDGDPTSAELTSASFEKPFPLTRMPSSSLPGVDVNGAVRLDPSAASQVAGASSVLVLAIDQGSKDNPSILTGSCRELACTGGGNCFGKDRVRRVSTVKNGAPFAGAFSAGHVLVLRDQGQGLVFDVLDMPGVVPSRANELTLAYDNFSTSSANLTYDTGFATGAGDGGLGDGGLGDGGGDAGSLGVAKNTLVRLPYASSSFDSSSFTVGGLTVSLAEVHRVSEPATDISAFYATRSVMGLFLLGNEAAPADDARRLKLVAVPFTSPADERDPNATDAGTDAR